MNKKDVIWLLIRIAGLYFLWQSVEGVFALSSSYIVASNTPDLLSRSAGIFLQSIVRIGTYLSLGLYMLLNGRLIFDMLSRQPDSFED